MKDFWIKLGISVATAIVLAILARLWGLVPNPDDYRIPRGTIAAFALTEPPAGWEVYEPGRGRFVIGATSGGSGPAYAIGQTGGRDASKLFPDTFQQVRAQLSGAGGSPYIRPSQELGFTGDGWGSLDARPPFVALLICRKL